MICGGATHCSIARRFLGQQGRTLALLLLGSWANAGAHVGVASAAETVDCAGINIGRLDVVLASGSSELHTVEMNEGDTLAFALRADKHATGTITLVAGDDREQRLLHGPHATQVSYTAERSGAVGFRLAVKGGKVATFITTCSPADGPGAMALDGLNVDMSLPLSIGTTAWKYGTATTVATPNTSALQWLGGDQSGTYGVNLNLQPSLMVGVLAQFDQASDPLLGPSPLSDQPWLAGPMASVQLGDGLSLDARAAWGSTDPIIGNAADRQTLDARLTSEQDAGRWHFSSSVGFAHVRESLGAGAGHTAESGRIDIKPEMSYRIDMGSSMYMEPKITVGTLWNLGDAATTGTATGAQGEAQRLLETGITFGTADGTTLQVGGGVQEGETRSDNLWSGRMQLNIPLK